MLCTPSIPAHKLLCTHPQDKPQPCLQTDSLLKLHHTSSQHLLQESLSLFFLQQSLSFVLEAHGGVRSSHMCMPKNEINPDHVTHTMQFMLCATFQSFPQLFALVCSCFAELVFVFSAQHTFILDMVCTFHSSTQWHGTVLNCGISTDAAEIVQCYLGQIFIRTIKHLRLRRRVLCCPLPPHRADVKRSSTKILYFFLYTDSF